MLERLCVNLASWSSVLIRADCLYTSVGGLMKIFLLVEVQLVGVRKMAFKGGLFRINA